MFGHGRLFVFQGIHCLVMFNKLHSSLYLILHQITTFKLRFMDRLGGPGHKPWRVIGVFSICSYHVFHL